MERTRKIRFALAIILAFAAWAVDAHAAGGVVPEALVIGSVLEDSVRPAAFSPDGNTLAYADRRLVLYDVHSGNETMLPVRKPYFVGWRGSSTAYALYEEGGNNMLALVDAGAAGDRDMTVERFILPVHAQAAYPYTDARGGFVLLVSSGNLRSFGLETSHELYIYTPGRQDAEKRFGTSRILKRSYAARGPQGGWLMAGPSPLEGRYLLAELVDPPVVDAYYRVLSVDPLTGEGSEIYRLNEDNGPMRGSWAPDGLRAAITESGGRLRILGLDGTYLSVNEELSGAAPAWNPSGSQIYFGGFITAPSGRDLVKVFPDGTDSAASWSPDGGTLAVTSGRKLHILRGAARPSYDEGEPAPSPALVGKVRVLRELLSEKLITQVEYHTRVERLINLWRNGQ